MFHVLEKRIAAAIASRIQALYGIATPVQTEQPKQSSFGEIALPAAFQLARELKKAPRAIAQELLAEGAAIEGVAAIEIAGNGYLNIRLDRGYYGKGLLTAGADDEPVEAEKIAGKIIVEHTNINPNKAAHIGHLRNAILGDTFVRMLRSTGRTVEVQNYIDNTGVQVADVVVGFLHPEVFPQAIAKTEPFDYLCWDLYAAVSAYYDEHKEALEWRRDALHAIESGHGPVAQKAQEVSDRIVHAHLATMWRLNVTYDVLPRESEILHLKFWATAFELLRQRKAIYFETEGKNKGCWVMPGSAFRTASSEVPEGEEDSKVIVRSNGTVTYVGKDIAYQIWKFGLLGKDFHYMKWHTYPNGHVAWTSTTEPQDDLQHFGRGVKVYNVIDSRQSYLQDVVVAGLRALGFERQAEASIHFSYEMVALSPRTCVELGIPLSDEDRKRPYIEVSGRKGLGVKADDLIDKLIEKALEEVTSRHADEPEDARREAATRIAIGALRYFMLKFTRNSVIAFDLSEALSFEGETGPYVQYAAVRARNILRKLGERGESLPDFRAELTREAMARQLQTEDCWQLLLSASKAGSAVERAVASGEPAHVARYAFQLAQSFSNFYHEYPVLTETDREKKTFLLWMTDYFRGQLERTLDVLGIQVPEYM
ncbi:MAG TPA: arginine--tRNA ligase [Bryobacteraceae bacterium]|jgi:arginyl-tRNA synthetase